MATIHLTIAQLEGNGYLPGGSAAPGDYEPIFQVAGVQHTLPAPLVSLAVASNILTMALKSNTLQQLSLKDDGTSGSIANITLARKSSGKDDPTSIYKIFSDPSGRHTIITTLQGENFYLFEGWTKARPLPKCKMIIESVAWNPIASSITNNSNPLNRTSTREILIGARNGTIFEALIDAHDDIFKTPDRIVQSLYSFSDRLPITGLHVEFLAGQASSKPIVVLVTSASRFYQFSGAVERRADESGKLFEAIFAPYRDAAPSMSLCL